MMRRRVVPVFLFVAALFAPLLVSADSDLRPGAESYFRQYEEITGSVVGGAVDEVRRYARDEVLFGESALDFSEWLRARGAVSFDRVVTQRLVSGGVDYFEGLGFVRDVEVRYESPLGERAGNFGFGALGSLRESADDVLLWELRGFVGEDDVAGANVGAAYRRLLSDDFLAGVNAFLDYERGGDDENFWRWSAGVEATGRHLDFSANRYWALSDAVMATVGGEVFRVYSADGWDAELRGRVAVRYPVAFRFLDSAEVAARYYVWESDGDGTGGGDADVSGARYRFGFVPLPQFRFGVEYDSGDGGGKNFGYYINFRHRLGAASESVQSDDGADVWSRRFDPVRREHQQHIVRTQAGAGVVTSVEIYLSTVSVGAAMVTLVPINLSASYSYVVASANPLAFANSVTVDSGGVVSYAGIVAGGVGGNVVFELTPVAGGAAVSVSVFFRDLVNTNTGLNTDGELPLLLSEFAVSATLFTVTADGALSQKFAIVESRSAAWANLLAIDEDSGVVTDAGLVGTARNGVVVFSVTDADGAVVFLTVRFGGLSFADVAITVHSLQASATVTTLMASGGSGAVAYETVSFEPAAWNTYLMINRNGEVIDSGAAAGGAATATVMVAATDGADFKATAAMVVEVLDDVSIAGSVDVVITPGDAGMPVATLTAIGGDENYSYTWESSNPASWLSGGSLVLSTVSGDLVLSDGGVAGSDAAMATAVFSATDGIGAMTVLVTAHIQVVEAATFVSDNFNLTLTSDDDMDPLLTLSVSFDSGTQVFNIVSSTPAGLVNMFMITEDADGNGVMTDNGAAAGGAASGMVVFSVTDSGNTDLATVNIVVYDDIAFVDDDITVTVNSTDATDPVVTLTAIGGDGTYAFTFDSANPSGSEVSLSTGGSGAEFVLTDNGIAAGGAATATLEYKVTDGSGMEATATVEIIALDDVGFVADDLTVTVASTDTGAMVLTLTATGGDGTYNFSFVSANPSGLEVSLSTAGSGAEFVLTDNGIAAGGAATAILEYKVTDGSGMEATATVEVIALADVSFVVADLTVTLASTDADAAVATLTANGTAPYTFTFDSADPSGSESSLTFAPSGNQLVISDNGIAAGGAATATLEYKVTDANSTEATATIQIVVVDDLSANAVDITVSLNSGSVGNAALTLTTSGGVAPLSYAVVSANPAAWMSGGLLAIADGVVTHNNLATATGDGTVVFSVTDNRGAVVYATVEFNYTAVKFSARRAHSSAVFNGRMYIIGGLSSSVGRLNDVWSSVDGVNWTQETANAGFPARYDHSSAVLGGSLFVIGGLDSGNIRYNDVWASTDGATWVQVTASAAFSAREEHSAAALGGTLFVIGGWDGSRQDEVWSSEDGENWTLQAAPGFLARSGHISAVLDGALFVIGGLDSNFAISGEVWSTTDGVSWAQQTSSSALPGRRSASASVLDGALYVMGGVDTSFITEQDDVWSSADGVAWAQVADGDFPARSDHTSVMFNGRIYVFGGLPLSGGLLNDVWSSADGINWTQH